MSNLRSPVFARTISAGLTAGTTDYFDYTKDSITGGSAPFNTLIVQNFSGQLLSASYGDRTNILISPYSIYNDEEAYGLRTLSLKNVDSNPTDKLVQVLVTRTITARDAQLAELLKLSVTDVSSGDW